MPIPSKPLAAGGVVLGGSAAAVGGTAIATKQTIGDKLENGLLSLTGNDEEWKAKVLEAKKAEHSLSLVFENVSGDKAEREALHKWCEESFKSSYGSALSSKSDDLLAKAKKLCVLTIQEKIGNEWLFSGEDNKDEKDFQSLTAKLKTETEIPLTKELIDINSKITDTNNNWKDLRKWCQETYSQFFKGTENNVWRLVNKFCKKPTILEKLEGTKLDSSVTSDTTEKIWKNKAEKAKTTSADESLKGKISSATAEDPDKFNALKGWCQEQYPKVHDKKLTDSKKTPLLSEVKKWCVILIEDKLDNGRKTALDGTGKEEEWKKLVSHLNGHTKTGDGDDNFDLPDDLSKVKKSINNEQNKWQELKTWCVSKYELTFENEDSTFKSVKKFCQKKNS